MAAKKKMSRRLAERKVEMEKGEGRRHEMRESKSYEKKEDVREGEKKK